MMSAQDLSSYNTIRMAGVIRESIVDGPGLRFVVFAQGCPHGCPGCHNPATHDFNGGKDCALEKILAAIDENPLLDGVTFSGGEPMSQPEAFCNLAVGIKERGLNLIIYTGYTYDTDLAEGGSVFTDVTREMLSYIDILVDGEFIEEQRDLTLRFRGSRNQRILTLENGTCTQIESCE